MKRPKFTRGTAIALIVGGDLLLLVLGWLLLVSPQRQTAASIARATQAAEGQIVEAQRAAGPHATPAAPKQPEIRTAALYELAKAMPSGADQADELLELDQVARDAGVSVQTITMGASSVGNGYTVWPIDISFSGDFYSLTDLFYRLRNLVTVRDGELDAYGRLFSIDAFALSPTGVGKALTASVTVDTFTYGVASSAASGTTPPPASTTSTDTTSTDTTSSTTTSAPADAAP
ncbi:MAG: type 4a pilus biogenesis protein PilO [Gaiellaceae bacterium]